MRSEVLSVMMSQLMSSTFAAQATQSPIEAPPGLTPEHLTACCAPGRFPRASPLSSPRQRGDASGLTMAVSPKPSTVRKGKWRWLRDAVAGARDWIVGEVPLDDTECLDCFDGDEEMEETREEEYLPLCAIEPAQRTDRKGELTWLTVDSGCGKSCCAKKVAENYKIKPSAGSRTGQRFKGPGGEVYHNEGEVQIPMITEGGTVLSASSK